MTATSGSSSTGDAAWSGLLAPTGQDTDAATPNAPAPSSPPPSRPDVIIPPPPVDTDSRALADDLLSPIGRPSDWVQDTEVPADEPSMGGDDMLAEPMHPSTETTDSESARAPSSESVPAASEAMPIHNVTDDLDIFVEEPTADEIPAAATGTDDLPITIEAPEVDAPAPRPESGGLQLVASSEDAAPPSTDDSLPSLDRDGYTVRFESPEAYTVQYGANIEHGGLVVRASALPLGTQRMLALEVPGRAAYTVSARVIYHQDGKLGFMLDSFNLHKSHLKRLAQAS